MTESIQNKTNSTFNAPKTVLYPSIRSLPKELILEIFEWMRASEVLVCSTVSKEWQQLSQNDRLWALLLKRDFPHVKGVGGGVKQTYRNCLFNINLTKGVYATGRMSLNQKMASIILTEDERLISGSSNGTIEIRDLKTGKLLREIFKAHAGWVLSLILTKGKQQQLISGSDDCSIKIWDLETGNCLSTFQSNTNEICFLTLDNKGSSQLISGSCKGTIEIRDQKTGELRREIVKAHSDWIRSLVVTEDGRRLISGSDDHTIKIWDLETGDCLNTLRGCKGGIRCLIFNEKKQLISGSNEGVIQIWDLETGKCVKEFQRHERSILSFIRTENEQLISGSYDKTIKIWDLRTNDCLTTFREGLTEVYSLILTKDGRLIAGGYNERQLKVLDFMASNKTIFQELVGMFKETDWRKLEIASQRFLCMPKKEREMIYGELHEMIKPSVAIDEVWQRSTPEQKVQAIENYLKKI